MNKRHCFFKITTFLLNCFFLAVIFLGVYITFKMNKGNRSLWFDEAALAWTFGSRGLSNLTSTGLEVGQSAPVIYLYIVKFITIIFGNTEYNLRIFSSISYIGSIGLIYLVCKKGLAIRFPLGVSAYVAMIPCFVRYSNVFKPYEFDALCVLLVIFTYYLYSKDKIKWYFLCVIWAVLIWASNPVCFFEGGFLIIHGVEVLYKKSYKKFAECFAVFLSICVSFIVYYFYWLSKAVDYMQDFWQGKQFPLLIKSREDLDSFKISVEILFGQFERLKYIILIFWILSIFVAILKKKRILQGIHLSFVITIFASAIGYFPVSDRLWMFSYPIISMTSLVAIYHIVEDMMQFIKKDVKYLNDIIFALILVIFILLSNGWKYLYSFNLWWRGEELYSELEYIDEHLTEKDSILIHNKATLSYVYKMGVDNMSYGGYENNVYYGQIDPNIDADIVESLNNCYIVVTHYSIDDTNDNVYELLQLLRNTGYVQLVSYQHFTPLYYYCTNEEDLKEEVNPDDVWY